MKTSDYSLSVIKPADNAGMAAIVRQGLTEYGANRAGFAWQDPELDRLSDAYDAKARCYWVIHGPAGLAGGCGIAPLAGVKGCCELQKMYVLAEYRGLGLGSRLMNQALIFAARHYHWCYLETLAEMTDAAMLYRRAGFILLPQSLGETGHNACDHWYIKELSQG